MSSEVPKGQRGVPLPPKRTANLAYNPSASHHGVFPPVSNTPGIQFLAGTAGCPVPVVANPFGFPNQNIAFHPNQLTLGMMAGTTSMGGNTMLLPQGVSLSPPGSPTFFHGWKLRSGKWVQEEEAFAELLIDMFDEGHLTDCMTGSTLRAYLASKLHCAPMRISKKYAGKGIGKKVYTSRFDSDSRKGIPVHAAEERRKRKQAAEQAEKRFHEAVSPDAPEMGEGSPFAMASYVPFFTPPQNLPFALQSMVAAQQYFSQPQPRPHGFFFPNPLTTVFSNQQGKNSVASRDEVTTHPAAQQLQESIPKVLANHAASPMSTSVEVTRKETCNALVQPEASPNGEKSETSPITEADQTKPSTLSSGSRQEPGVVSIPASSGTGLPTQATQQRQDTKTQGGPAGGVETLYDPTATILPTRTVAGAAIDQTQLPDFMAGFDKVALDMKPPAANVPVPADTQPPLQCSPPFTSRSFDDFHRLLGKDLSPLDEGCSSKTNPIESPGENSRSERAIRTSSDSTKKKFDNAALFTAESYAMFAQESARAASQHAAYLSHDKLPPRTQPQRSQRIGSFDFDSTMQLVSQHVPTASMNLRLHSTTPHEPKAVSTFILTPPHQTRDVEGGSEGKSVTTQIAPTENSAAFVSGSEPASSAAESSFRGSTSESNGSDNTFSNSEDGQFESGEDSHSSDDLSFDDIPSSVRKPYASSRADSPHQFDKREAEKGQEHNDGELSDRKRKLSLGQKRDKRIRYSTGERS